MKIMFHGTNAENAAKIMKDGFAVGTFFARHLEDALHFGGDYIFEVYFETTPTNYWEYICDSIIPPSDIRTHYELKIDMLWDNEECVNNISRQLVKERDDDSIFCETCIGKGQMEYYPSFTRWTDKETITVCETCNGFGYTESVHETV